MTDYKGVLGELRSKRTALQKELEQLDIAIRAIENLLPATINKMADETLSVRPPVTSRTFSSLTMPEALEKCLRLSQQPLTKKQIVEMLQEGGKKATKSFGAHVYNTLHRLSKGGGPFHKDGDGRWGLAEWQSTATPTLRKFLDENQQ